jgi:hypothetical protein
MPPEELRVTFGSGDPKSLRIAFATADFIVFAEAGGTLIASRGEVKQLEVPAEK